MPIPEADSGPPSDKDALLSAPTGDGADVLLTVNQYRDHRRGALVEETSAFRSDIELFYDLHTLVWDRPRGQTLDVRDDAVDSDVSYDSARVPEIHLRNEFRLADGSEATLTQDVVASVDTCGLLLRNRARFDDAAERTLFTVLNLGIKGHDHDDPHAVQEAHVVHEDDGCDFLVATDGERYLAVTQERPDGAQVFDGYRVGHTGVSEGPDRSAWADIYEENDGWLDAKGEASGNLDAGFGLSVDDATAAWLTGVGFGYSADGAVSNARAVLESGYESEREQFAEAWEAWHADLRGSPIADPLVTDLYEKSLTSLKCAQDGCCGTIAGAFKPEKMTYKFIWPRDQVIITQALCAAGATDEARLALQWFRDQQITDDVVDDRGIARAGTWWQNYYATGEPHWRALQLDQVGGPIYAHWLVWQETDDDAVLDDFYAMSRRAAEFLLDYDNGYGFPRPHQDPWEEIWGHSTEGSAAAIAGLRSMAAMADARDDDAFATACRDRAAVWADHVEPYCFKRRTPYGDHYVTADSPETPADPPADRRPDAAAFMAVWPWNVVDADDETMRSTLALADDPRWRADDTPCVGRYPGDRYTPTGTTEDGGWPLCEAYADVVRWRADVDADAVADHVFEHADEWTTAAGLLPERVDGDGSVSWNANLQWSQAMYLLLAESHARDEPYGLAPGGD